MDLGTLALELESYEDRLNNEDRKLLDGQLASLASAFPFNQYEYTLMFLLCKNAIAFEDYEHLRGQYVAANRYLHLFELAPRIFGDIWGRQHVMDLAPRFARAEKSLNGSYVGQYDLWIEGIRVEVKAARAIDTKRRGSLVSKALRYDDLRPFWMNYQQLKPDSASVFVFIGVWLDRILYWVLTSNR